MFMTTKEAILKIPKEIKLICLEDNLKNGEYDLFIYLTKILTSVGVDEGGVSEIEINDIANKHNFIL